MACLPGCTSSKQHGGPATLKDREGALHMQRILTSEVKTHVGERVRVEGWLHSLRQLGGVNFLVVRDGWGLVQAVTELEARLVSLTGLSVESVIAVEGLVVNEAQAPGGVELHELHIEVITPIQEPPPLPLNKRKINASINTLLDQAVVMNRHPARRAILRLNAGMLSSFRCTLTERVFEAGPVFRAEPHDTTRHLNEYVSLDLEMGFIESHFTLMATLRDVIANILSTFSEQYSAELALLRVQMPAVPEQ